MKEWIGTASSADQAIARGLKEMGLNRDQVDVHILEERTSTLFSLFGLRRVRVKLAEKIARIQKGSFSRNQERDRDRDRDRGPARERGGQDRGRDRDRDRGRSSRGDSHHRDEPRPSGQRDFRRPPPPQRRPGDDFRPNRQEQQDAGRRMEPAAAGARDSGEAQPVQPPRRAPAREPRPPVSPDALLGAWKEKIGWEDLQWTVEQKGPRQSSVTLKSAQAAKLMEGSGRGLEAFQYLFNLALNQGSAEPAPEFDFQIEGHKPLREEKITDIAQRAAEEVRRSGRAFRLDPMDSWARRLVHQTLANDPDVETFSEGEGPWRKVVVRPKQAGAASAQT